MVVSTQPEVGQNMTADRPFITIWHRFIRFGMVGGSGVMINLSVLWLCREFCYARVQPAWIRINLALATAVALSTLNNYLWNRMWTWQDRKERMAKGFWTQAVEYYLVCAAAIGLQVLFTNLFLPFFHYLLSNMMAILLAAVVNFKLNDIWTFNALTKQGYPGSNRNRQKCS